MDPILFWNDVALEANRVSHTNGKNEQTGPTLSSRALAIVHLAMYDAYAGVINKPSNLPLYIGGTPVPSGASPGPAVAAAAHETLSKLFPSQKPYFDLVLAGAGDTSNPGHAFGVAVAQKILADRAGDPGADATGYVPSQKRGRHRLDPDNPGQGFHAPFYGAKSKGFAITARHTLKAPPFDDNEYEDALREVRYKGIAPELMGTLPDNGPKIQPRTMDETLIGIYWGYDGASGLGTPPRLYNQIVREVAINKPNTPAQNARLFAFVHVAMADAGILAWEEKYRTISGDRWLASVSTISRWVRQPHKLKTMSPTIVTPRGCHSARQTRTALRRTLRQTSRHTRLDMPRSAPPPSI
jgi:hypothetical protein